MIHPTLLFPFSLLLALPVAAQSGDKKPAAEDKQSPKAQRPKDDKMTAKDPAIVAIDKFIGSGPSKGNREWRTTLKQPPKLSFDAAAKYDWVMKTNKGEITIRLLPEVAPMHVSSTIYLSRIGYYDDLTFHRVIKGFMAQGGCPLGSGTGGPGYKYAGEFDPKVKHDKPGLLSMANAGPGTDGSQFFLTFVKTPHLDGKHTIFGEVVSGMEVLKALEASGSQSGRPAEKLEIQQTWIVVSAAAKTDAKGESKEGVEVDKGADKKG